MLSGPVQHQRAAGEDEQNDRLAGCYDSLQQLLLVPGQVKMSARRRFTGHVARFAKGEDRDVGVLCGGNRCGEPGVRSAGDLGSLGIGEDGATLLGTFRHGGAQGAHIAEIVCAGPCADHVTGIIGERADKGDALRGLFERQESVLGRRIVLQQDERLLCCPAGKWAMLSDCSCYLRAFGEGVIENAESELDVAKRVAQLHPRQAWALGLT